MTTGSFPSDASRRRAILVLQNHDIERCGYEKQGSKLLIDEEAYILPFPIKPQNEESFALTNIIDYGLARPGAMLIQNPFDEDSYEEAATAPTQFALAKHMHFSTLCALLGAREVRVEQIDIRTRTGKTSVNVIGSIPIEGIPVGIGGEVAKRQLEQLRSQMNMRDEFSGGPPDIMAAEMHLRRTRLLADANMRSLLDMRRHSANRLMSRSLTISLSSESKKNLRVAARLEIPQFLGIGVAVEREVVEQHELTVTVAVKF
ncbi:MAG: hypothetical protein FWD57_06245 [Polyangiaceae bacterium]|nr:hypothetical protein [Polyangiaceae bacterium]